MPAAKLTPEQWTELRTANEAGVETEILASRFGVSTNTIRQRRHREGWVTPRKLEEERMVQDARNKARAMSNGTVTRRSVTPSALGITAATMTEKAQEGSLHAMAMFADAILQTQELGGIDPARNGKELLTLLKGLRLPSGLDNQGMSINIGAFFGTNKAQARQERDVSPARAIVIPATAQTA